MNRIERICELLEQAYGRPTYNPQYGPLDELVLTILSQNTSSVNYSRAFAGLQRRFASWEEVRTADVVEIEDAIRVGGLARIKAGRIRKLLDDIRARHDELSLGFLADMPDEDARNLLIEFDGVGVKTASCVLMFSLQRPVFPVDTHIHRIAQRLGLITCGVSAQSAHGILQSMIPNEMVYSLHVNLVTHGRRVCKARSPLCGACCLLDMCPFGQSRIQLAGG